MQSDRDIGRMNQSVPVAVGKVMEHFAETFLRQTASVTAALNAKTVGLAHMLFAYLSFFVPRVEFLYFTRRDNIDIQSVFQRHPEC